MPFLYSISRTLFPKDQPRGSSLTMHRNHPQCPPMGPARRLSETIATATTGGWKTVPEIAFHTPHRVDRRPVKPGGNGPRRACTTGFSRMAAPPPAYAAPRRIHPTKSFTTPLNPRRRPVGWRSPRLNVLHSSVEPPFPVRHTAARRTRSQAPAVTGSGRINRPHPCADTC